jgi:hypothetical protein
MRVRSGIAHVGAVLAITAAGSACVMASAVAETSPEVGTPGGIVAVNYSGSGVPAAGFTSVSYPLTVLVNENPKATWYWADEFGFLGENAQAYVGLQPGPLALFSVFGPGSQGLTEHCATGADGGEGTSCHLPYPWSVGRTYVFTVSLQGPPASTETWRGTVTDTTTGTVSTIGEISVALSRGLLSPQSGGFSEYFSSVAGCPSLPVMQAKYGAPSGVSEGKTYTETVENDYTYCSTNPGHIDCKTYASASFTPEAAIASAPIGKPQSIAFTSPVPAAATAGGTTYGSTATASSGLAVSLSAETPTVCAISGATVNFVGAGTCTVVAQQFGNHAFNAAPEVQQSFAVLAANSSFSALGLASSASTGAITFTGSVNDPGTFSWLLTFKNGGFGVFSASNRCRRGQIRLSGRCRPSLIVFGRGSVPVAAAGPVTFTVKPTASGLKALRNALKRRRGLRVTATLTFRSSAGGSPVTHTQLAYVKLKRR